MYVYKPSDSDLVEAFLWNRERSHYPRYTRLSKEQRIMADYGVARHLYYCRQACEEGFYDPMAIKEIVEDAGKSISVARSNQLEIESQDYSIVSIEKLSGLFSGSVKSTNPRRGGGNRLGSK